MSLCVQGGRGSAAHDNDNDDEGNDSDGNVTQISRSILPVGAA